MSPIIFIFAGLFTLALARNVLFWVSYVQRKQYRLDRLWHALNDVTFWKTFWSKTRLAALGLFVVWQVTVRVWQSSQAFDLLFYCASVLFAFETFMGLWHFSKRRLEMPKWTVKSGLLTIIIFIANLLLLRLPWVGTTALWRFDIILPELALLVAVIEPCIVFALFSLLFLPNWLLQKYLIREAVIKRSQLKRVQTIGITGSVGKTSMKEYVAHFLSTQFRVLKTTEHINVDTGIAQQVRNALTDNYDFYVVEMGAYRIGEIASICRIVKPTYGVMTALGNQHLELFGSPQRLRDAKFELAVAVGDSKKIFANFDSARLRQACADKGISPSWFGLAEEATNHPTNIAMDETGTRFDFDGQTYTIPGFGAARLTNVVGALALAAHLGVSKEKLVSAARKLPTIAHTTQFHTGKNGSLIIDSTYNASTDSVLQAVADLAYIKRKKRVIVFKDILELGSEAEADHLRCVQAMAQTNGHLLLLPSPWLSTMKRHLETLSVSPKQLLAEADLETIEKDLDSDTVILCLGRDTQPIMNKLLAV